MYSTPVSIVAWPVHDSLVSVEQQLCLWAKISHPIIKCSSHRGRTQALFCSRTSLYYDLRLTVVCSLSQHTVLGSFLISSAKPGLEVGSCRYCSGQAVGCERGASLYPKTTLVQRMWSC